MFGHSHQKVEVDICLSSDKYVFNKFQKKDELFMNFLTKPTNLVDERGIGPVEEEAGWRDHTEVKNMLLLDSINEAPEIIGQGGARCARVEVAMDASQPKDNGRGGG
jgi:hypothetical protein